MKKLLGHIFFLLCITSFAQNDSIPTVKSQTLSVSNNKDTLFTKDKPLNEIMSVEFNPGLSIPSGNFASGDYTNPSAGYAKEGYSYGANITVKLMKELNVMLCYSRQMNVFDEKSFEVNALKGVTNYSIQTDANWRNHFILAGLSGNIALDEDNFLTPRLLVGICVSKTPKYESVYTKVGTGTVTPTVVESESETNFAMRFGVGLRKNLNKQLFMSINPDFYMTNLRTNINKPFFGTEKSSHQSVSIISISLSIGFRMYN